MHITHNAEVHAQVQRSFCNPKKADWYKYIEICEGQIKGSIDLQALEDYTELDNVVDLLTNILNKAFEQSCSLVRQRKNKNPPYGGITIFQYS